MEIPTFIIEGGNSESNGPHGSMSYRVGIDGTEVIKEAFGRLSVRKKLLPATYSRGILSCSRPPSPHEWQRNLSVQFQSTSLGHQ